MLIKMGDLLVSHEKAYMSTADEVPERFPVKIAFARKLNDQELMKLAVYALMVENGIEGKRVSRRMREVSGNGNTRRGRTRRGCWRILR